MKNLKCTLGGLLSLYLAWLTISGKILNYISFADPLNEMMFFVFCCIMSICLFICVEFKKI